MTDLDTLSGDFTALRGTLTGTAYRLLGVRADAEDAVQEAWLRLAGLDEDSRGEIDNLAGWLTTVVARICLDRLRSAPRRRESYVGQWLPEPVVAPLDGTPDDPLASVVHGEDVRMAAMVVLDRLGPEQRVAFVLHDAFAMPFAEIAEVLGCSAAAARQYASRGRRAVADADVPPPATLAEQRAVVEPLLTALAAGDVAAVTRLLHPDVVLVGDSNGKARTAKQLIVGQDKLSRFLFGLLQQYGTGILDGFRTVLVNGELASYTPGSDAVPGRWRLDAHLWTVAVRDGQVWAIYDHANPDKLRAAGL